MQDDSNIIGATEELAQQLQLWRRDNKPPTRIPAEYWDKAVELAARQGVSKTAHALRVDYMSLKRRVGGPVLTRQRAQEASFLEWIPPLPGVIVDCSLGLTSSSGSKLRVRMKNVAPAALASLLRDFAGQP